MSSVINYDWIDNKINKVKQKDIKYNEQVMGLADNIFWDYIKEFPNEYGKLVFFNKEEDCTNDTKLGHELYDYIRDNLESMSDNFKNNEDDYFQFC